MSAREERKLAAKPERQNISPEEVVFCQSLMDTNKLGPSFRKAFPKESEGKIPQEINRLAKNVLERPTVKAFLEFSGMSLEDQAVTIFQEQMLYSSSPSDARNAAKEAIAVLNKQGAKDAVTRWFEIAQEIGAEVEIPPSDTPTRISLKSLSTGEANLKLPLAQSSDS